MKPECCTQCDLRPNPVIESPVHHDYLSGPFPACVSKPESEPKPRNLRQLDDQVPRDPWDKEYFYVQPGKHNPKEYDIFSAGPDRLPDTEEDNIGNWESAN